VVFLCLPFITINHTAYIVQGDLYGCIEENPGKREREREREGGREWRERERGERESGESPVASKS